MLTSASSSRQLTCWAPVPDAAMMPTLGPSSPAPRTFAKPRPTPETIAVPQSGPITSSPRCAAVCFRTRSCSSGTLSEKIITCRPVPSASIASPITDGPGTDSSTRAASGADRAADRTVRGAIGEPNPPAVELGRPESASAASTAAMPAARPVSSSARTAISRSLGPASAGTVNPRSVVELDVQRGRHGDCATVTPWRPSRPG